MCMCVFLWGLRPVGLMGLVACGWLDMEAVATLAWASGPLGLAMFALLFALPVGLVLVGGPHTSDVAAWPSKVTQTRTATAGLFSLPGLKK